MNKSPRIFKKGKQVETCLTGHGWAEKKTSESALEVNRTCHRFRVLKGK